MIWSVSNHSNEATARSPRFEGGGCGGGRTPAKGEKKGGFAGWWDDTLAMSSSPETGRLWADPIFSPSVKTFSARDVTYSPPTTPLSLEKGAQSNKT